MTFQVLALCSVEELTLETSAFQLFTVANLRYLLREHPVVGEWLKVQISRLSRGCKNLMTRFSMSPFKPAWLKKMQGD